jgi:histidyl-tRNA synthetase
MPEPGITTERPIAQVRGTRDWLPGDYARLAELERTLLDCFAREGYRPLRTPILEFTELHERKSGAGIVAKLFELSGAGATGLCLRPELTASIVRAYADAAGAPALPWRVSMAGPVFRYEAGPTAERLREFTQVGVEMLGAGGPEADAEIIALADRALGEVGIGDAVVRIGHVGLILERLEDCGLPPSARHALIEVLSEAAAEGQDVRALDQALERLGDWLRAGESAEDVLPAVGQADERGVDRLFRQLVPDVSGRRTGDEIIGRLRRKWDLGHTLQGGLARLHDEVRSLSGLKGPARDVLAALEGGKPTSGGGSLGEVRGLVDHLEARGIAADRIRLDLGFGRGIGFYTRMIFELVVSRPEGPIEVCGGGRYDGLARVLGSDRDDRGVGFAFGLERLLGALDRPQRTPPA